MYWSVRSNSFSESARVFPISHISRRTVCSRTPFIRSQKSSMQSIRPATVIVGHLPFPAADLAVDQVEVALVIGAAAGCEIHLGRDLVGPGEHRLDLCGDVDQRH